MRRIIQIYVRKTYYILLLCRGGGEARVFRERQSINDARRFRGSSSGGGGGIRSHSAPILRTKHKTKTTVSRHLYVYYIYRCVSVCVCFRAGQPIKPMQTSPRRVYKEDLYILFSRNEVYIRDEKLCTHRTLYVPPMRII